MKPNFVEAAKAKFIDINITVKVHEYPGLYIGTDEGKEEFVKEQIKNWVNDIEGISSAAECEPHLGYCAHVYGTCKKWNFLRTTPSISHLLHDIENTINSREIPALIGRNIDENYRYIFTLTVQHGCPPGGMALANPTKIADREC